MGKQKEGKQQAPKTKPVEKEAVDDHTADLIAFDDDDDKQDFANYFQGLGRGDDDDDGDETNSDDFDDGDDDSVDIPADSESDDDDDDADDEVVADGDKHNHDKKKDTDFGKRQAPVSQKNGSDNDDKPRPVPLIDDDSDSDIEKPPVLTIGNVPLEWYDDLPHLGYDLQGKPVMKPKSQDELDRLLQRGDDPNYSRTITDEITGEQVHVTDYEMEIINRIRDSKYANPTFQEEDEPILFFSRDISIHPLSTVNPPKARFIPSKWEKKKVLQLVRMIRQGLIKVNKPKTIADVYNYDMWDNEAENSKSKIFHTLIPAPKLKLPGHAESYNPPQEYLWNAEEKAAWAGMDRHHQAITCIPTKYSSLRDVPAYAQFIRERFDRCLDLYLCPRAEKQKVEIDAKSLIPKLPSADELRPFPSRLSIMYLGHRRRIRSISCSPDGQYLVSGSDDCTVRVWEVSTSRMISVLTLDHVIEQVAFNPNKAVPVIGIVADDRVYVYCPDLGSRDATERVKSLFTITAPSELRSQKGTLLCRWVPPPDNLAQVGIVQVMEFFQPVKRFSWHKRGDYFATVCPKGESAAVLVHHLSRRASQKPFAKTLGHIECVSFHPTKPLFFVGALRHVHVYNLLEQKLVKRLTTGMKMISSISVHSGGDNLIVGGYDRRIVWFDLDMKPRPYKILKFHQKGVRSVQFHPRFPLFASASDDSTVHVFHGMVYDDLNKDPLIVPLKILRGHTPMHSLGVLDCEFHPTQPWIFSCGADHTIRLFISP